MRDAGYFVSNLEQYFTVFTVADVIVAHNQAHEIAMEDYRLPEFAKLREGKYETCTASRARRLGLPGSLEDCCRVLRTPHQKAMEGHGVMLQCSQPRPAWLARGVGSKYFEDADRLAQTAIYCAADILAESDLHDFFPELPPTERRYWLNIEKVNRRGVPLDVPLIDAMSAAVAHEQQTSLARVAQVTNGVELALTNPQAVLAFLKTRGVWLDNLRKETVEQTLREHDSGERRIDEGARIVLEVRQQVGGKTSISKLPRMRQRVMSDGRARDMVIYHGAHTGRVTGDGINVLNLPRPYKKFNQDEVVAHLFRADAEGLRKTQGVSVSTAVSAALRGVITAGLGRKLIIGDYKSIEPCFYFTLCQQWDAVEILRRGESLYIDFGQHVYGRTLDKVRDLREYTTVKETVLGCSYGLGKTRFNSYLANKGVILPSEETDRIHDGYHRRFNKIKEGWRGLETAAKAAIRNLGTFYDYNGVSYVSDGWWLVCVLPSGRSFYYPNARLRPGKYDDEIVYEGWLRIDGRPAGWGDARWWGGTGLEQVSQSTCRDVMEEDKQVIEAQSGWEGYLDVYDELVAGAPIEDRDAVPRMKAIMERDRPWMPGMPVLAEVFEAGRYQKR